MTSLWCLNPFPQYHSNHSRNRGQIGIGTLVLLIATLLIATTTVGVLVHATDVLQSQSEQVNRDIATQTSSRVSVIATTGIVSTDNATSGVDQLRIIVKRDGGDHPLNLSDVLINLQGNRGRPLSYSGGTHSELHQTFGVEPLRDEDKSVPLLDQSTDRAALVIATSSLAPTSALTIELILPSGTTYPVNVRIPPSLENESAVPV